MIFYYILIIKSGNKNSILKFMGCIGLYWVVRNGHVDRVKWFSGYTLTIQKDVQ